MRDVVVRRSLRNHPLAWQRSFSFNKGLIKWYSFFEIETFITRWPLSGGSERANFQSFANELIELLAVPKPHAATADRTGDSCRFERPVTFVHTVTRLHRSLPRQAFRHRSQSTHRGRIARPRGATGPLARTARRLAQGPRATWQARVG